MATLLSFSTATGLPSQHMQHSDRDNNARLVLRVLPLLLQSAGHHSLAVVLCVLALMLDKELPPHTAFLAEVGAN